MEIKFYFSTMTTVRRIISLILLFLIVNNLKAQETGLKLSEAEVATTVDAVSERLQALYVFPEAAEKMSVYLRKNLEGGQYKSIQDPIAFADQLTEDLQSISKDKHLRVFFDPKGIAEERQAVSPTERALREKQQLKEMDAQKFGFEEVKMLEGKLGYLDLRAFMDTTYAAAQARKAMSDLSRANAIIIDLRNNGGGSPTMIQLLSSYFFTSKPVHLNSFYFRPTNTHTESWTLPYVRGKRKPNIELFILTSDHTFSAAEEFTYNLKNLERATIIGETTGGGAHPGGPVTVTDRFRVWIPTGRAINPITGTNWEGVGVEPDIEIDADQALLLGKVKAYEALREKAPNHALKDSYRIIIEELKSSLSFEKSKFADVLVKAEYKKWNDEYDRFYGGSFYDAVLEPYYIDPKAVLGNNKYYVSIPKGSSITVQFTDNLIVDSPNRDDLFVDELANAGDHAEVYVSSDGLNYEFLGVASGGKTNSMDLADIGFTDIVSHVTVVGLDTAGSSPGFDLIRVYGLPHANIDLYVADNELKRYLDESNVYNRRIHLSPIEFEFDSHVLREEWHNYLDNLIDQILSHPEMRLKIVGHTDNIGSDDFNDQLSAKRAKSVYDYFIERGIKSTHLTYEGRGRREPLNRNDDEEGRKKNRRVELIKME